MNSIIQITSPDEEEFKQIINYISLFELDNRELNASQFLAAKKDDVILGFGRIRRHSTCDELCSLGVIEPERNKNIGSELTKKLIQSSKQPLYLVCIIPEFFERFGFKIVTEFPPELNEKLNYCTSELVVPEKYVVMKYFGGK